MTVDTAFSLANTTALAAWIVLAFFQRRSWTTSVVCTVVAFFAATYAGIIAVRWSSSAGGFSSLEAVATLFSDRWLLLAGWLHYLAFDLLVGRWETQDASARGLSQWLVVPCLGLTFIFGPAGLLAYLALRTFSRRTTLTPG